MSFEFRLPDIGEGVAEGEVVQWFVKEGDTIREDAPLVSVLTDKANVEIPSPKAGRVTKIHASVGQKVKVGGLLVTIEAGGEGSPPPGPTAAGTNPPDARAQAAPAAPAHAAASPPVARATPVASTSPPDRAPAAGRGTGFSVPEAPGRGAGHRPLSSTRHRTRRQDHGSRPRRTGPDGRGARHLGLPTGHCRSRSRRGLPRVGGPRAGPHPRDPSRHRRAHVRGGPPGGPLHLR